MVWSERWQKQIYASMEPRFFKRGNNFTRAATTYAGEKLQWNHVFSNVEIHIHAPNIASGIHASMEPRFFKRGNLRLPTDSRNFSPASMEPRFFKRGNALVFGGYFLYKKVLQWNHVFSNVEMLVECSNVLLAEPASMEPRFFKRGNHKLNRRVATTFCASMEPRFFKRGNDIDVYTLADLIELQWNHVFSNVEISPKKTNDEKVLRASMEPRFFKRGNDKETNKWQI